VLVAPGRLRRPWNGNVESLAVPSLPDYDPNCYLCPGNERANGVRNPRYLSTFVFNNDFSSLSLYTPPGRFDMKGILRAEVEQGICRVICFTSRHDLTLAEMETKDISEVLRVCRTEYESLGKKADVNYVQIFENKGALMGSSNPHPHCQVWAERSVPVEPSKEENQFRKFRAIGRKCLLCEYMALEVKAKERVIYKNKHFMTVVPFWAIWPFEAMIIPRLHVTCISNLEDDTLEDFATAVKDLTVRYDNLFKMSFPYSSGIHQAPTDGDAHEEWHMHMHFYPPLLRSATVKKFMVGYELMANPQRDLTPEEAAEKLRSMPTVHYKCTKSSRKMTPNFEGAVDEIA